MCVLRETCGTAVALEHNGDLYSCDHYVEPDHLVGNITETHLVELMGSDQQVEFGNAKRDSLPQYCRDCEVRFVCNGNAPGTASAPLPTVRRVSTTCARDTSRSSPTSDPPMKQMAALLRAGRDAPEVMTLLAAEESRRFASVGRNDLCPCGSGAKFKRCHGR
ncbi:MAG: SPASM domain-containing protein [Microthrixaceae bacterium]|nr:SPASM domain-containing protein [Microthrixaceae bacterium]